MSWPCWHFSIISISQFSTLIHVISMITCILKLYNKITYYVGRCRAYKALRNYLWEKENAYRASIGYQPKRTLYWYLLYILWNVLLFFWETFAPRGMQNFMDQLWNNPKSEERKMIVKIGWFLFGVGLSWLCLGMAEYVIGARRVSKMFIVTITGVVCPYFMATSPYARGLILILIPMMTGRQVRGFLVGWIILSVTFGPMENFRHNAHALGRSSVCGAVAARNLMKDMKARYIDFVQATYRVINEFLGPLIQELKNIQTKLRNAQEYIDRRLQWISDNVRFCDQYDSGEQSLNSVKERCTKALAGEGAWKPYQNVKGWVADKSCDFSVDMGITFNKGTSQWCETVRRQAKEAYNRTKIEVIRQYEMAIEELRRELDVRVDTNVTNNNRAEIHAEFEEIWDNVEEDLPRLQIWNIDLNIAFYNISPYMTFGFTGLCAMMAFLYLGHYLASVRYDNTYITAKIRRLDEDKLAGHQSKKKKTAQDQEPEQEPVHETLLLPLTFTESSTYVNVFSLKMSRAEISALIVSMIFFVVTAGYAAVACLLDVATWLIQDLAFRQARELSPLKLPYGVESADGDTSDQFREAWHNIQARTQSETLIDGKVTVPKMEKFPLDEMREALDNLTSISFDAFLKCMPEVWEPDWEDYARIWSGIGYLAGAAFFAAYVLRLRQLFAGWIYPKKAKERELWLYNHILALRSPAVESIRRHKRKMIEDGAGLKNKAGAIDRNKLMGSVSVWDRMVAASMICNFINSFILRRETFLCSKCGGKIIVEDKPSYVECPNQKCQSLYHTECAENLNNTCMDCSEPIQKDDPKAMMEERDSSDDSDMEDYLNYIDD